MDKGAKTDVLKVELKDKRFLLAKEGVVHLQYDKETLRFSEVEFVPDESQNTDEFGTEMSSRRLTGRSFSGSY
jgi:hypothetical protein